MAHTTAVKNTITLGSTNTKDTALYQKAQRILSVAFSELGYQLKIADLPNKRSLVSANNGSVDGSLFRVSSLDLHLYNNLARVDEPLFVIDQSVIGKQQVKVDGWQSMKQYIISYERGTHLIETNKDKFKSYIEVGSFEQSLQLISIDRADITIASRETATDYLSSKSPLLSDIIIHQPPLLEIKLHVFLNKNNFPNLAKKLSNVLIQMKKDGRFQQLSQLN